ncbi:MAG: glycosyltransferase [Desulfobacteraceae bacterium]|nr:glycosyltransferase [Desulfobacteraceae bacterium]
MILYSIIIILDEKNDDIVSFVSDLNQFFSTRYESFEIIAVINGYEGFYKNKFNRIDNAAIPIKSYSLYRRTTQAVCIKAALKESNGEAIVVFGAYQQITMESLGNAIEAFDSDVDIVIPCRRKRVDPSFNQIQSRLFNWMVRKITGVGFTDLSCTVRIIKKDVLSNLDFYGNMYRFLPVVAALKGFRYKEIDVDHHREMGKTGFYSVSEYCLRILDILSLFFLIRYTKKPFRFFSFIGSFFLGGGLILSGYVAIEKIVLDIPMGNRTSLMMGILLIALGVQSAATGLIGEIISFVHGRKRKEYTIDRIVSMSFSTNERRKCTERRQIRDRRRNV